MSGEDGQEKVYQPAPTLTRFHASNKFYRGIRGPFGSGKSTACIFELLSRAMEQEPYADGVRRTRWVVVRNTYRELLDTTWKTWVHWLDGLPGARTNMSKFTWTLEQELLDGTIVHCEVLFRALDTAADFSKILSLEVTGGWINEAREVPYLLIRGLSDRLRYPESDREDPNVPGPTWRGIILDTNSPDDSHWWYEREQQGLAGELENWDFFVQPPGAFRNVSGDWRVNDQAENLRFLAEGYYEQMIADAANDEDYIRVYVGNEYGILRTGKPVFHQYSDTLHSRPLRWRRGWPMYRAWDFGQTPCCLIAQEDPKTLQLQILQEFQHEHGGIEDIAGPIKDICMRKYPDQVFIDVGDPSGGSKANTNHTAVKEMAAVGIKLIKGNQDLDRRLECVRQMLSKLVDGGKPKLVIHDECKTLRKALATGYSYKKINTGGGERYALKPDKDKFSHLADALQYLCVYVTDGSQDHTVDRNRHIKPYKRAG